MKRSVLRGVRSVGVAAALACGVAQTERVEQAQRASSDEAAHALSLPRGIGRAAIIDDAARVFVHPDVLLVGSTYIALIEAGRVAERSVSHHHIEALHDALRIGDQTRPVVVHADRALAFGTVIDVLYTASRAGRQKLRFAVAGEPAVEGFRISPAWTWDPTAGKQVHQPCGVDAVFDGAQVSVSLCGAPTSLIALDDLAAMRRVASESLAAGHDPVVRFRGPAAVPWETVVTIIDALGGPECVPEDHQVPPRNCGSLGAIVDLDPPLPRAPGNWAALRVSFDSVTLWASARRPRSEAELRERVTAAVPALESCLRASNVMQQGMPESVTVVLGTDEKGREVSRLQDELVPSCVAEAFAPSATDYRDVIAGDAHLTLRITFPDR